MYTLALCMGPCHRQYVDYGRRAWGPQEEELGDKEMSPFVFNKRVGHRYPCTPPVQRKGTPRHVDGLTLRDPFSVNT